MTWKSERKRQNLTVVIHFQREPRQSTKIMKIVFLRDFCWWATLAQERIWKCCKWSCGPSTHPLPLLGRPIFRQIKQEKSNNIHYVIVNAIALSRAPWQRDICNRSNLDPRPNILASLDLKSLRKRLFTLICNCMDTFHETGKKSNVWRQPEEYFLAFQDQIFNCVAMASPRARK